MTIVDGDHEMVEGLCEAERWRGARRNFQPAFSCFMNQSAM